MARDLLDLRSVLEERFHPAPLSETIDAEMVVQRLAADCAVDHASKLLSRERHDVAADVIASRWIVEGRIDARDDGARGANDFEHRVPNRGRNQGKPFEHQLAPFGTARMSFRPSGFQLMGTLLSQGRKQGLGLLQVLVTLCKPFRAPTGDDELVDGIARRSRHVHVDAGTVQDDRGLGIADQEIQERSGCASVFRAGSFWVRLVSLRSWGVRKSTRKPPLAAQRVTRRPSET
ncbi:hypothetical protein [Bradyrhizobium sp. Gha]|uniref:hypothetical protein n=1 Tax=Bradyrhizobium sp. Gha TaxID=1855318 RepID=UPI0008EC27FE|nr:hypothetical protein [Bradyrhizobium sp. Gha]SFJ58887.1 hypothetical protein SAMN05216525_12917 [Bradyrhizobium sp. Gha]